MAKVMEIMPIGDHYPSVDFSANIVLECSDGNACVLPKALAQHCEVLSEVIKREKGEVKIPLSEIRSDIINKIYLYLDRHHFEWPPSLTFEKPIRKDLKEFLTEWDYSFYSTELLVEGDPRKSDSIFLVLKAAQYLNCEPIREFACAALANIVRNVKSEEDFYKLFNISEPFTAEEKERLYEDYEYRDSKDKDVK